MRSKGQDKGQAGREIQMKPSIQRYKEKAKELKQDVMAVYLAYRHQEVPWYAKLLAVLVVGYALSPVDLIPDFIPILGYLDDLILLPLGIILVVRLIPKEIMEECRAEARELHSGRKPRMWVAGALIVVIWIIIIAWIARIILT